MRPSPMPEVAPAALEQALDLLLTGCGLPAPGAGAGSTLPLTRATLAVREHATAAIAAHGLDTGSLVHVAHRVQAPPSWCAEDPVTLSSRLVGRPRTTSLGVLGTVRSDVACGDVGDATVATVTTRFLVPPPGAARPTAREEPPDPCEGRLEPRAEVTGRLTARDVERFAGLSGDHGAVHHDLDAARAAGFAGTVAHGTLLLALVERGLHLLASSSDSLSLRLVRPVVVAGPVAATPVALTLRLGAPDHGRAGAPLALVADGATVVVGTARTSLPSHPHDPEETS